MTAYYAKRKAWWKECEERVLCAFCPTLYFGRYGEKNTPLCERHKNDGGYCFCGERKKDCEDHCEDEEDEDKDEDGDKDEDKDKDRSNGRCSRCNDGIDGDGGMYNSKPMCAGCITEICNEAAHEDAVLKASSGH
jgi:hypothetical protein